MYNRCSLPRLVVETDGERKKENQQKNIQDIDEWPEISIKRGMPNVRGRRGKRLKLDEESLKGENPRQEGIDKRKSIPVPETELEREFKRLRPEFDIEREVKFICNQEEIAPKTDENSKPMNLFDIFKKKPLKVQFPSKTNSKPSNQKSKKKTVKNQNRKESLTHSTTQKIPLDIRNFMKVIKKSEDQLHTNLGGSEVRERESGEANWDPGLY